MNETKKVGTPREQAMGLVIGLFVLAAMSFMDIFQNGDSLLAPVGIGFSVAGLYALRRTLRMPR